MPTHRGSSSTADERPPAPGPGRYARPIRLAPLVVIAFVVVLKLVDWRLHWRLIREDGPFEDLTALAYLLAAAIGATIGVRFLRDAQRLPGRLYLILSAGFFFVGGEEISWGQRVFDVESPEVFERYNLQGETNLHNFADRFVLHSAFIAVSAYCAFGWRVLRSQAVRSLVSRRGGALPAWRVRRYLPGPVLTWYFVPTFLLYIYYDYLNPLVVLLFGPEYHYDVGQGEDFFIVAKDQEFVECLMAFGFLLFVAANHWRQDRGLLDPRPRGRMRQAAPA